MDEREGVLGRAIESLRELPDVRPEATARLLVAVAAERQREREAGPRGVRQRPRWVAWGAVAGAAVLIGAFSLLPGKRVDDNREKPLPPDPTNAVIAVPASNTTDLANSLRPVQLVLSAPNAKSVRVVRDFNGWDEHRSPMAHDSGSGLWSATLMLRPGRHVYAFVVNDFQWMRDPRAPAAPDADFGRPGSVVLVGRP